MSPPRSRFAPSPTGFLHVGGLRTALYAYLFAKKNGGQFILRIEDTDQNRLVEGAVEKLIATLRWAGLDFDEGPSKPGPYGPYIQSQRLDIYKKHAQELLAAGHAYYCFCSPERLEAVRAQQISAKLPPAYDKFCRKLDSNVSKEQVAAGEKHVIRMKVPSTGEVTFHDIIRGSLTIGYSNVDDQVLIKSDGFPTYHLAVVVDDHYMRITHIIRGEEWLSSTPKHLLLYQFFGWEVPATAHLPLLLNLDRSKLSKRQGDVAVEDYRDKGYLKEALVNFVALLGWNPGDTREIFTLEQLQQEFSLERVGKSGAVFDVEKLKWMNTQHLRLLPDEQLLQLVKPILAKQNWGTFSDTYLQQVFALMRERVVFPQDFVESATFFYKDPEVFDAGAKAKSWTTESAGYLTALAQQYKELTNFDASTTEQLLRAEAARLQVNAGKLIHPLRFAVSGFAVGPTLFEMLAVLGQETVVRRLEFAIKQLAIQ
jgi:glutamyl-tRNA synthetase